MYAIYHLAFFWVLLCELRNSFALRPSLRLSSTFFHVANAFSFSVMVSLFQCLAPKLFCFTCIWLLVCLRTLSSNLQVECFSLFRDVLLCFYWSRCIVCFNCVAFLLFVPTYFRLFSLSQHFCFWRRLHISASSLISHPDFEFMFAFFRGSLFLCHTLIVFCMD